ncbi:MAG: hypothetical protein Q4P32_11760, partial [Micrococcales bacterium]|nr:hypothetical protein [Micrococcales bacterium]
IVDDTPAAVRRRTGTDDLDQAFLTLIVSPSRVRPPLPHESVSPALTSSGADEECSLGTR